MTAQILDGTATLPRHQGRARRAGGRADASTASRPGSARCWSATTRARHWYVGAKHKDCASIGIDLDPPRPAGHRDPGRGRGRDRRAQRRPGLHRVPRAAADRARRVRAAVAGRPRQGRRRAAPDQPGQAGARRARPAAVHAGRGDRAAAPPRRRDRGRRGGRGRPRADRRPAARAAAHPAYRERDGHPVPHRHPRPGRATCATPTSSWRPPACPTSSPPTWSSPAPPCSTWASPRVDGKIAGDVAADVAEVAGWVSPNPGGVGPMTRAMLLTNVVSIAEEAAH